MRKDTASEAALHIALLLAAAPAGTELPAARLAGFHALSPGSTAKLLQRLVAAGVVAGSAGRTGGYRLARPPAQISALDIVRATGGVEPVFRCREIRRQGVCAVGQARFSPRCTVARIMDEASRAWDRTLAGITLDKMARDAARDVDPQLQKKTGEWIAEHAR